MSQKQSDNELIEQFKAGNQDAFETLINRYVHKAFGLALRLTRSREDAEEVLQDVFINVYKKIHGFERKSSFSSWFYRITVNSSFMKLRKRRQSHRVTAFDDLSAGERSLIENSQDSLMTSLDRISENKRILTALNDAIQHLPEEYRAVFILRDVDGFSTKQVSKTLNLTAPAVKSRLHRSRMMVRKRLLGLYREYFAPKAERRTAS